MPYRDIDSGHRIGLAEDVMAHSKQVFEQGLQLEAILLAHEYLEQRLNAFYRQAAPSEPHTIHRKFKQLIDLLRSEEMLAEEDYEVLNEFNRLRNVNSNQILNFSLTLQGAKKGDMIKAMELAAVLEQVISRLFQELESKKSRKGRKKR